MTNAVLLPLVVLVAWSLVMGAWATATRVSAMRKARIHPEKTRHTRGSVLDTLPSSVRQIADNYNHLMEQPTIFYAIVLVIALSGGAGGVDVGLAWAYVVVRITHSIWQATANVVMVRFYLFMGSALLLIPLTGRALYLLTAG